MKCVRRTRWTNEKKNQRSELNTWNINYALHTRITHRHTILNHLIKLHRFGNLHRCAVLCGVERTCLKHVVGSHTHTLSGVTQNVHICKVPHFFRPLWLWLRDALYRFRIICCAQQARLHAQQAPVPTVRRPFLRNFSQMIWIKVSMDFLLWLLLWFGPLSWIRSH